jgi:hypothetical protein
MSRLLLPLFLALLIHPTLASAAERFRLASVPLDMPMDDGLDEQALDGLYQGDYGTKMAHNFGGCLGRNVERSGLQESPFWHIDTALKDGRSLELWFSSGEDGRKIFGVRLETPWAERSKRDAHRVLAEVQDAYGKPDLELQRSSGKSGRRIQVFVDRTTAPERLAAVTARLPAADKLSAADVENFWKDDLREWTRILGPDFRGAIVSTGVENGKMTAQQAVLIDLARARTVFNRPRWVGSALPARSRTTRSSTPPSPADRCGGGRSMRGRRSRSRSPLIVSTRRRPSCRPRSASKR